MKEQAKIHGFFHLAATVKSAESITKIADGGGYKNYGEMIHLLWGLTRDNRWEIWHVEFKPKVFDECGPYQSASWGHRMVTDPHVITKDLNTSFKQMFLELGQDIRDSAERRKKLFEAAQAFESQTRCEDAIVNTLR